MAVNTAIPGEVKDFLDEGPESFAYCRMYGHNWEPTHVGWVVENIGKKDETREVTVKCARCTNRRVDVYDRWWSLVGRSYPDAKNLGYHAQGFTVHREDVREWAYQRSVRTRPVRTRRAS